MSNFFQVPSNEISGHIYSNSYVLLNFNANECFTITVLPTGGEGLKLEVETNTQKGCILYLQM